MSNDMKIAAAIVRQLREARAWSQEQLATVSGISPRTVQRVESEGVASLDTRMALAAALECEPAALLESAVAESAARAQLEASSAAQPSSARSSSVGLSLAWLLFVVVAFLAVAGYNVGQDLADRDNGIECKRRAKADETTCGIDVAEQRTKVAKTKNADVPIRP
jgi:transcriptional regulator with XRE-family HTH domain